MSFWEDIAKQEQVEGGGDLSLPANVWYVGDTTTQENGGARPKIDEFEFTDKETGEPRTSYKLGLGMIVRGGEDKKSSQREEGRFVFFDNVWINPNPEGSDSGNIVSGRMTGLLNALFSSGVAADVTDKKEQARLRWQNTVKELAAIAEEHGLVPEDYDDAGGLPVYLTAVAVAHLQENSRRLLFKTRVRKDKQGTERLGIGSFEDATEANMKKRKVSTFEEEGGGETRSF